MALSVARRREILEARYAELCEQIAPLRMAFLVIDAPARKRIAADVPPWRKERDQAFNEWPGWRRAHREYLETVEAAEAVWWKLHPKEERWSEEE